MKSRNDDVQHTSLSVSLARENSQQAYLPGMCRTVLVDDLVHIFTNDIMPLPIHPLVKLFCYVVPSTRFIPIIRHRHRRPRTDPENQNHQY